MVRTEVQHVPLMLVITAERLPHDTTGGLVKPADACGRSIVLRTEPGLAGHWKPDPVHLVFTVEPALLKVHVQVMMSPGQRSVLIGGQLMFKDGHPAAEMWYKSQQQFTKYTVSFQRYHDSDFSSNNIFMSPLIPPVLSCSTMNFIQLKLTG